MKKNFKTCLVILLMTVSSLSFAASRHHGYHWVVETTSHTGTYTIFRIYQHDTQLVYEEMIPEKKLDIRQKKVRRQLDRCLNLYVQSMEQMARLNGQSLLKSFTFR